ncbi:MAG: flippase [Thermoleophilia bacterium]
MQPASRNSDSPTYLPHVAKGALINLSGMIIRTVLAFGYTVMLARMLPVSDLGWYFLIMTVVNIIALACTAGMDFGVVRYVSLYAGEGNYRLANKMLATALSLGVSIGIGVAAFVIALAPVAVDRLHGSGDTSTAALRIYAISIPFWVAARLFNSTTQGLHRMSYQVYSRDLGEQLSKLTLTIAVLMLGAGLLGVIWANVASVVVAMVLSMFFALKIMSRHRENRETGARGSSRDLLRYSLPLAFSNMLGMLLVWSDMLIMGYLGTSTEVGFYGAALRVGVISSALFLAFATVFTPVISDLHNKRFAGQLNSLYKTVTRWIFICTFPLVLLQLLFADPIMTMFGNQFAVGSGALMILALSQLVNSASGPAAYMVLMSGRSRMELYNISVALAVNVLACFLLIPSHGVIGAALANLAATVVINTMRATEVWIFMHTHAYDLGYIKPLLAGTASAALVLLLGRYAIGNTGLMRVAILAAGMLVVYTAVTVFLGLSAQDKTILGLVKTRLIKAEEVQIDNLAG